MCTILKVAGGGGGTVDCWDTSDWIEGSIFPECIAGMCGGIQARSNIVEGKSRCGWEVGGVYGMLGCVFVGVKKMVVK